MPSKSRVRALGVVEYEVGVVVYDTVFGEHEGLGVEVSLAFPREVYAQEIEAFVIFGEVEALTFVKIETCHNIRVLGCV